MNYLYDSENSEQKIEDIENSLQRTLLHTSHPRQTHPNISILGLLFVLIVIVISSFIIIVGLHII